MPELLARAVATMRTTVLQLYMFRVAKWYLVGVVLMLVWYLWFRLFGSRPDWPLHKFVSLDAGAAIIRARKAGYIRIHALIVIALAILPLLSFIAARRMRWNARYTAWPLLFLVCIPIVAELHQVYQGAKHLPGFFVSYCRLLLLHVSIPTALVFIGPLWAWFSERLKENTALRHQFASGRGASSRWAGSKTYSRYSASPWSLRLNGLYMGRTLSADTLFPQDVVIEDDAHVLTIAQTGSGKSKTSIEPNLNMYAGSAIVVDPKGDNARIFAGKDPDTDDIVLDPYGHVTGKIGLNIQPGFYNLLSEIDVNDDHAEAMIGAIGLATLPPATGQQKFFVDAARLVFEGTIAHVLSTYPEDKHRLDFVADLLIGEDAELGAASPEKFHELIQDMRLNDAAGGLCKLAATTIDDLGPNAYGGVSAEFRIALKWIMAPKMREHMASSSFRFMDMGLGKRKRVFIVIPLELMEDKSAWLRSLVETSMWVLQKRRHTHAKPSPPILFILDELPAYGMGMTALKKAVAQLRGAGVKIWPFVQDYGQLEDCFGTRGARSFESGGTIQVYGINDDITATWLANRLGNHTIKEYEGIFRPKVVASGEAPLMDAAALDQIIGKDTPLTVVLPTQGLPMRLERRTLNSYRIKDHKFRRYPFMPKRYRPEQLKQ